jgi:hypothetical protein
MNFRKVALFLQVASVDTWWRKLGYVNDSDVVLCIVWPRCDLNRDSEVQGLPCRVGGPDGSQYTPETERSSPRGHSGLSSKSAIVTQISVKLTSVLSCPQEVGED